MNLVSDWLSSRGLMPHGFCYQWNPALVWLHAICDTLIALAYFSIPVALVYFVRRRRDIPFGWMFICFSAFIFACGATHLMDVWTLWVPSYWLSGGVKVLTVLASVPTAVFLVRLMPTALSLPNLEAMRRANEQLKRQAASLRESEERFRQMAQNIQEIFWMIDPETKEVTYVSPAFEQICELPIDSLYSNPASYPELIFAEDRARVLTALENLQYTNRFDEEFRIVCPNGTLKWVRAIGFTSKDSAGMPTALVGTVQEITSRKEMEFGLRESEDRYRDLVENSTDLICTHDLQGRLLSVNELPVKLLGYARDDLLNKPMRDFLLPEARAQFDESLLTIQKQGFVQGLMVVLTKSGERRIWEYHNTLRTEGVSNPVVRGIAHDVTDQKRLEKALRLSEEKFAKAFHSSPVEMTITTLQDGRFLDVNEAFERNNGFSRLESIGRTSIEIGLWDDPYNRAVVIEHLKNQGRVRDWELKTRTKSGNSRIKLYSAEQIQIGTEQCLLAVCEDITSRKQVEDALKLSEEKFSKAFRASPGIISITTLQDSLFLDVNESFEKQTGYSRDALLGRSSLDIGLWVDPRERELLARDISEKGFVRDQEIHFRAKSGQVAVIQLSAEVLELHGEKCLLKVGQDITSRKLAEEELLKAQARIESVLNSMTDAHILFDLHWRYLYVNEAAIGAIGLPREQILGQTLWDLNPDIVGTEIDRQYRCAMHRRSPVQFDFHHPAHDTWWEYRFYPAPEGLAVFATEITERKRAEERLREYEKAVEGLEEMIVVIDREYRLRLVNRAYANYRGREREQLVGHLLWDDLDSAVADNLIKEKLDDCLEGNIIHFETKYRYSDLGDRDLRVSYFPIEDDQGVDRAVGIIQDITQHKRAEQELQRLSGHLLRLQDEERRRIARELHDSTGQDLVALATTLSQLHASMPSPGRKPRILASRCKALADQCIREIRTLSYLLYPPMLDESGLDDAIQDYANGFSKRTGIQVQLGVAPHFGRLTPAIELALFRIVQESLTNIVRHSGSIVATIRLDRKPGLVSLEVSDKGSGTSGRPQSEKGTFPFEVGVGIQSMRERVKLVSGEFAIDSCSSGTTVRATVPLND